MVEFGARRAHGIEAGVLAARAAFIGGCVSTSNVEAGRRFGIPVSGTMAHSWVMSFEDEVTAFRQYARLFGEQAVLLLDTYDTVEAARAVVAAGLKPSAVRLDSGDLIALSSRVRAILDDGGLHETKVFASGDLDEWRIDEIVRAGAPVDGFGVGARSEHCQRRSLAWCCVQARRARTSRSRGAGDEALGRQAHISRQKADLADVQ